MKRIVSIQLENFRAFYGQYPPINLQHGQNLLLYGENGSGKSSLFKALKHFFQSSRQPGFYFEENTHIAPTSPASIKIEFCDIDVVTKEPVLASKQLLTFSKNVVNNNIPFIQNTDLIKGFLDYRNLLKVYFDKTNLFNLIVNEILLDHILVGQTEGLGIQFQNISEALKKFDRRFNIHKENLIKLRGFESTLRIFLDRLFLQLNHFLIAYFKFNLRVWYELQPLIFDYDPYIWDLKADLRLSIKLNGQQLINHNEYLNEARLSALGICLYLASQKLNPAFFDYKIMFLDDVFIGLDASNRIPILNILQQEFAEYQIFITTYDRYWFELAKRFFNNREPNKWLYGNLYVGTIEANNISIERPILIQTDNDYSKAVYYLHHTENPDYPAAANYFRKYAEEILKNNLPPHEIRNEDNSSTESFKLSSLVSSGIQFLKKINADPTLLLGLDRALPTLLHPLSHFNLSSPIYKKELIGIQDCLLKLQPYLIQLRDNYKVFIPKGRKILLNFTINVAETGHYEIQMKETIYLVRDITGNLFLSSGHCFAKTSYVIINAIPGTTKNFNSNDPSSNYSSIESAYNTIYNYIITKPQYSHITRSTRFTDEFTFVYNGAWQTLSTIMIW